MSVSTAAHTTEVTVIRKAATVALLTGALLVSEPVEVLAAQHREATVPVTAPADQTR